MASTVLLDFELANTGCYIVFVRYVVDPNSFILEMFVKNFVSKYRELYATENALSIFIQQRSYEYLFKRQFEYK